MSAVTRLVDLALSAQSCVHPGVPPEMIDPGWSEDDWRAWKAIPSTVTEVSLAAFESARDLRLPPPYRELLLYVHHLGLDEAFPIISLGSHPPDWEAELDDLQGARVSYVDETGAVREDEGLFVIGSVRDEGPLCLDLWDADDAGDCPVLAMDHETAEGIVIFSSTARMVEALTFVVESSVSFIDPWGPLAAAPEDLRERMRAFLAIDPEGAGGPGRDFWTAGLERRLGEH